MNHSNSQPSHDNELSVGVIGDNPAVDGVSINVATGKNSIKKRKSSRTKRDIANRLGGIKLHATDGGNGGVDAPVDLFGISNNSNFIPSHDDVTPDGVIGDNAMGEGVLKN